MKTRRITQATKRTIPKKLTLSMTNSVRSHRRGPGHTPTETSIEGVQGSTTSRARLKYQILITSIRSISNSSLEMIKFQMKLNMF